MILGFTYDFLFYFCTFTVLRTVNRYCFIQLSVIGVVLVKMPVCCLKCDVIFSNQSNLNRHLREIHEVVKENVVTYDGSVCTNFKCAECNYCFKKNDHLRRHLHDEHNLNNDLMEILKFTSYEDFSLWLRQEEFAKRVEYFKASTCEKDNFKTIYYSCNRSGKIRNKEAKSKITKLHGSCKINKFCTSQIVVKNDLVTGFTTVMYYYVHYGHDISIKHIRLPKETKNIIARKLVAGVSPTRILMDERKHIGVDNIQIQRKDLLTRKDINNVKVAYKIQVNDGVRHKDDATSFDLWIRECLQDSDSNPVIFYKKQGSHLEGCSFENEDFCLIIMTPGQHHVIKNISNNIVCVDTTHGVNAYNFDMTTLLMVDEFGEGFPGAFMYCNKKDTYTFEIFFRVIKEKCGNIHCRVFMSDIYPAFYNAWQSVMGPADFNLYCSWHVDRCWQKHLHKVADKDQRTLLYKCLKSVQYTLDEEDFENKLQSLLMTLEDESLSNFKRYFTENYIPIKKQWAYAYRKECNVNTNMHLENMHRNLKYVYFDGKKIKRMDKSIHMLIVFTHERCVERLIKFTKGKTTKHMMRNHACHRAALLSKDFEISLRSDTETLINDIRSHREYVILKKESHLGCCYIKCNFCNICIHSYRCSCMDFLIRSTICVHIHYKILNESPTRNDLSLDIGKNNNKSLPDPQELVNSFKGREVGMESRKRQIRNDVLQIINDLDNENISSEGMELVSKHIKIAKETFSIAGIQNVSNFVPVDSTIQEPSDKKICKQASFFSTKKKRDKKDKNFKKPSEQEENIIEGLLNDHCY